MNAAEHNRIIAERFWNDPKWAHTSDHVKWTMYLEPFSNCPKPPCPRPDTVQDNPCLVPR
jgi:hypothetical protein